MLVFRIIATLIISISCITCFVKNVNVFLKLSGFSEKERDMAIIISTVYGWLWRAFIIVALWLI